MHAMTTTRFWLYTYIEIEMPDSIAYSQAVWISKHDRADFKAENSRTFKVQLHFWWLSSTSKNENFQGRAGNIGGQYRKV